MFVETIVGAERIQASADALDPGIAQAALWRGAVVTPAERAVHVRALVHTVLSDPPGAARGSTWAAHLGRARECAWRRLASASQQARAAAASSATVAPCAIQPKPCGAVVQTTGA